MCTILYLGTTSKATTGREPVALDFASIQWVLVFQYRVRIPVLGPPDTTTALYRGPGAPQKKGKLGVISSRWSGNAISFSNVRCPEEFPCPALGMGGGVSAAHAALSAMPVPLNPLKSEPLHCTVIHRSSSPVLSRLISPTACITARTHLPSCLKLPSAVVYTQQARIKIRKIVLCAPRFQTDGTEGLRAVWYFVFRGLLRRREQEQDMVMSSNVSIGKKKICLVCVSGLEVSESQAEEQAERVGGAWGSSAMSSRPDL
ncbi:hypothetical protein B0T21DRAFT_349251 [Apiosordaria backusii]|uniref:Uncharacterized protein n=1 Tax=Apiosordaria backusii TaxID=314023 RepID=A0AA40BKI9_9PEZI|nr:hypothetical protein B0T21DRAFT_349251 [Apiosordaria backusii]